MKPLSGKRPGRRQRADDEDRLAELAGQMSPDEWTQRMKRLAGDMVAQAKPETGASITHAECEEMLAAYASDEQQGQDVRVLYPAIWRHLQTCARCAESYALLAVALGPDPVPATSQATSQLPSFLPFTRSQSGVAWARRLAPQLLGNKPRVSFLFNPSYLQRVFAATPMPSVRSVTESSPAALLLDDQMLIHDQPVAVEAWIEPSRTLPQRYQLHVHAVSPSPLAADLRVRVHWGDQDYVVPLAGGEAWVEDFPAPGLSQTQLDEPSPEFRLIFEAD